MTNNSVSFSIKVINSEFCLHTEKVDKPTVTCRVNNSSGSNMSAVLQCSAGLSQNQPSLTFEWISGGNIHPGNELAIFLGGEIDEQQYTCRVSNPASHETSAFTAKDCNAGRTRLHCGKQQSEPRTRDVCASVSGPSVSTGRTAVIVVVFSVWVAVVLCCVFWVLKGEQ